MYGLLETIYDKKQINQIESLYENSNLGDQFLIRASIAQALKDKGSAVFRDNGSDWILCTLATHNKSPEDTLRVFQSIIRSMDKFSFGILTEDIQYKYPYQIADTCLIGLGFFRNQMERLHQRRAAPSPNYYSEAGRLAFLRTGYESIGDDFSAWTAFIENEFAWTL
jgi:hypothetical protein